MINPNNKWYITNSSTNIITGVYNSIPLQENEYIFDYPEILQTINTYGEYLYKVVDNAPVLRNLWDESASYRSKLRKEKRSEIKKAYEDERDTINKGFTSSTLGVKIDCRSADLQNVDYAVTALEARGVTDYYYVTYSGDTVPCTRTQLKTVLGELCDNIMSMWEKKQYYLLQIKNATTEEELRAIHWEW